MKKIIPILLLAIALSDQCFAQTVADGMTVNGGPVIVGADPGGAELLRVGGGVQINRYYSYSFAPMVNGGVTYLGGLSGDDLGFGAANLWHNHHVTLAAASTSRTFDAPARLQVWPTAVTIGSDPGGSELLRVGGGAKFGNLITSSSATQPGLLATCSSSSGFSTLILGNTGASGRQFTIGLGGNTSGQNGLLYFYDNTALATRGYIKPDGAFIWGSDPNPGGNELLRVGGNGTSGGIITGGNVLCNMANAAVLYSGERGATARHITMGYNALGSGTYAIQALQETVGYTTLSLNERGGNVTIGDTANLQSAAKLTVAGTITAKEIKVTTTGADYVFENDYKLRPLAEVESFIAEHKHLPEMMSAKAMQADGMPVSEVVTKQLAKIEELTLYAIKSERERQAQADRLALLEKQSERLAALEKQIANVTALNARLSENMRLLLKRVEQDGAGK